MHTNAIDASPNALIPVVWTESVRSTCRLTVTAFLLFGFVTALSGCSVSTTKDYFSNASGSDGDPDSIIGKSRGSFLREFDFPNAQFMNDSDGATFFVYERYTLQKTELYWPFILALAVGACCGDNLSDLSYVDRDYHCVLLRFGPDDRLLDYAVKGHREGDNCTNEFASQLAGTRTLPVDVLNDELARELTRIYGDRRAAFIMARGHEEPKFIRTLAEKGDTEAATELARTFKELGPLRKLAEQGDTEAAIALARIFAETGPLQKLAKSGDAGIAYETYEVTVLIPGHASDSRNWLCKAANEGHVKAQIELGYRHQSVVWKTTATYDIRMQNLREAGFNPDDRIAYMWYTLAAANAETNDLALDSRRYIMKDMTDKEIAEAKRMVQAWKPGQCPGPWPSSAITVQ